MTPLRIALLLHSPAGGGAQRRGLDLAGALAKRGFAVTLVLIEPDGPLKSAIPAGIEMAVLDPRLTQLGWVRDTPMRQCAAAIPALAGWLRRNRPDILMAAANHVHLTALFAHALAGSPGRLVLRAGTHLAGGEREDWLKRRSVALYTHADGVVAVSDAIAGQLARLAPKAKVAVLPNPVVDASFPARMAAPSPHPWLNDGKSVLLGCGRLNPQKDFPTLIRAAALLGQRLIILGEGPERHRLTALAQVLRVQLELPGFVADPLPWMVRASAFALCSTWEGLPGALIEAMACGCPSVATDAPGGAAAILDGLGPLVPVGNEAALAQALMQIMAQPPSRAQLIKRAQAYSVEAGAAAYAALFTALAEGH